MSTFENIAENLKELRQQKGWSQENLAQRKESKRLLNLAKHAVEIAIEQGKDAAIKLLEED